MAIEEPVRYHSERPPRLFAEDAAGQQPCQRIMGLRLLEQPRSPPVVDPSGHDRAHALDRGDHDVVVCHLPVAYELEDVQHLAVDDNGSSKPYRPGRLVALGPEPASSIADRA